MNQQAISVPDKTYYRLEWERGSCYVCAPYKPGNGYVEVECFIVTGRDRHGKPFRITTPDASYASWMHAQGINLWEGTRWAKLTTGKKVRLQRVS